jgi:hypothetical protein
MAYRILNITIVAALVLGIFLTLGNRAFAGSLLRFMGIDTTVSLHGFATVKYKGEVYHLTEGDTIGGFTVVLIDATDNQIIVKHGKHLEEIRFTKP